MNILILSNSIIFRQGMAEILKSGQSNRKVYTSDRLNSFSSIVSQSKINYCFVDFEMLPVGRWVDELTTTVESAGDAGVCLLSGNSGRNLINAAYKTGIRGLISEESDIDTLTGALNTVLAGRVFFPRKEITTLDVPLIENEGQFSDITFRQKEILNLLYDGNSNKQIGRYLGISESTVKQHFGKIFKSLSVSNRVEALQKARDLSII